GPLLRLYCDAWTVTKNPLFARVADETAGWVMREMQSPEGGYYSSLDADSEHEEGKFYVWTPGEVQVLVSPDEYAVLALHYGLGGTWRRTRTGRRTSPPTWTTTPISSRRSWSSCRRNSTGACSLLPRISPKCCSSSSRTRRTAGSSSPATITSG